VASAHAPMSQRKIISRGTKWANIFLAPGPLRSVQGGSYSGSEVNKGFAPWKILRGVQPQAHVMLLTC